MTFDLFKPLCPQCYTDDKKVHTTYQTKQAEKRQIIQCLNCSHYYAETSGTPWHTFTTNRTDINSYPRYENQRK